MSGNNQSYNVSRQNFKQFSFFSAVLWALLIIVSIKVRELRPHLAIQLTSGLADISPNSAVQAVLETNILQKPCRCSDLIKCVGKFFEK